MCPAGEGSARRLDLDAVRIGAFAFLITYHVGGLYGSESGRGGEGIDIRLVDLGLALTHPWRMCLLFLLSGVATALIMRKPAAPRILLGRVSRLILVSVFGAFVVNAPLMYVVARERIGYAKSFGRFIADHHLSLSFTLRTAAGELYLAHALHLWFLLYLALYTLLVMAIRAVVPGLMDRVGAGIEHHLRGARIFLWPIGFCAITRLTLLPFFGESREISANIYAHADFFAVFLLGFAIARREGIWRTMAARRLQAAIVAVVGWALYGVAGIFGWPGPVDGPARIVATIAHSVERWSAIVAILGYAYAHFRNGVPGLSYLRGAILPYYVLHGTILVLAHRALVQSQLPAPLEAMLVLLATVGGCALAYEIVRPTGPFGILIGGPVRRHGSAPDRAAEIQPTPARV